MPDYLCIAWTAGSYSAALYAAPGSYGTILSFVEPAEAGTTSAGLYDVALDSCVPYRRGGIPELRFSRVLGPLTSLPDPWMGQQCAWFHGSSLGTATCYFTGDITNYVDRYDHDLGWTRDYRALGLRNRADWIPVTDSNTLSDSMRFNMPANNLNTIMSRQGRTVGQAVLDVLSGHQNQAWLGGITGISTGYGIGNYTSEGYGGAGTAVLGTTVGTNNKQVASIAVTSIGSGYTTAPTVVIAGPCTSQATAYATVSGGSITSFTVTYAGSGYLTTPAVIVSNLPSSTVNDCAALNVIAPFCLAFAGERILSSVESVTQTCHPNHWLSVDPVGNIRILDQRQNTVSTITLNGSDPRWSLPTMTRDTADTYSEVIIRGGPNVVAVSLSVNQKPGSSFTSTWAPSGSGAIPNGGLLPWFTFGSYTTNAAAEAAWSPAMYQQAGFDSGQDEGSLTCPDTLTCILTSTQSPSYVNWAIDQLDQSNTGLHAILFVFSDTIPGFAAYYQARIIANAATTSGGTSSNSTTVTLDQPLPGVGYNSYHLWALSAGGNVVWRRYKVMNADIAARMQQFFPYPFAYSWGNGTPSAGAFLTTSPVFTVGHTSRWVGQGILAPPITPPTYTSSGGYPAVIDPDAGTISFVSPTAIWDGFTSTIIPPVDVQAFIPVANGVLEVFAPAASYFTGTAALIEGIYRIKVITCRDWTDYSNTQNMQAYANELLQSMCDVVLEGSTSYLGLATAFLSPAQAVQITGSSYTTGWEGGGISNPQIVSGGSGYSGTMTYTITGSGAGGVLSSIVTGGVITSVWVSTRGSGYTGAVTVSVSGSGGGSGASITLQSEALPVASMDVRFQPGPGGTSYVSTLHLSNRRARYTSEIFVRPAMRGATWGAGVGYAAAQGMSQILGNTDFSSGAMGAFNEAAAGNPGQAAIPEIASLGQTPAEQTRAKQRADQDFERNLLESSGSGDSDDNPPTVKQQQRERAISMQGDREAAAARATPEPVNESFEKFAKRTKAAPPAPPPAPNQIPTDEAMEVARNWPKDQADLEQSRRKQPPAPNNPYAE